MISWITKAMLVAMGLLCICSLSFAEGWSFTDMDGIHEAGRRDDFGREVAFAEGLYGLESVGSEPSTEYRVLVEGSIVNPDEFFVVVFPHHIRSQQTGYGYLFSGELVMNRKALQLSPLEVGDGGQLVVSSRISENSEYLLLRGNQGKKGPTYILTGTHSLLRGRVMGLNQLDQSTPQLSRPSQGLFGFKGQAVDTTIAGDEIVVRDKSYEMISVNGPEGALVAIAPSEFNPMGSFSQSEDKIVGLVTFVKGGRNEVAAMIFRPTHQAGQYRVDYKRPGPNDWLEYWKELLGFIQ